MSRVADGAESPGTGRGPLRKRLARISPATWAAWAAWGLFTFTMLWRLMHSPLWGDEWNEWVFSRKPFAGGAFHRAVAHTFQPPLYNVLAHFWLAISKSPLWFRLLNVPLGWLAAGILHRTVSEREGRAAAAAAVAGLALCHQWVWCIQECSEYALMLVFLFFTLRCFLRAWERFSPGRAALFLLGCVGAVWSQYGAVFVVVPCAVALWGRVCSARDLPFRRKAFVTGAFALAGAGGGVPLWWFYLRGQMAHNQIAGHAIALSPELFRGFPCVFGEMAAWFFAWEDLPALGWAGWAVCTALALAVAVSAFRLRGHAWRALAGCLLASYALHFLLVRLQVYAMVRPGESGGFFCRYSWFYLPVLAFWTPAAAAGILRFVRRRCPSESARRAFAALGAATALALAVPSAVAILRNRHKAWDDVFAEIWVSNRGWETRTFLDGTGARFGFLQWVGKKMPVADIPRGTVAHGIKEPLPDAFWIWHSNWRPEKADETLATARDSGYEVPIECRHGDNFLAFCRKRAGGQPRGTVSPSADSPGTDGP